MHCLISVWILFQQRVTYKITEYPKIRKMHHLIRNIYEIYSISFYSFINIDQNNFKIILSIVIIDVEIVWLILISSSTKTRCRWLTSICIYKTNRELTLRSTFKSRYFVDGCIRRVIHLKFHRCSNTHSLVKICHTSTGYVVI